MQFCAPSLKGSHRSTPLASRFTALTERPSSHRSGRHSFASAPQIAVQWWIAHVDSMTLVPFGNRTPATSRGLSRSRTVPPGAGGKARRLSWNTASRKGMSRSCATVGCGGEGRCGVASRRALSSSCEQWSP
jgi:hypothetical protein